jgi:hypothetical protein
LHQIFDRVGQGLEGRLVLPRGGRDDLGIGERLGGPRRGQILADRLFLPLTGHEGDR